MADGKPQYKSHNHPAGGWGAAAATAKVLMEQRVITTGSRARLAVALSWLWIYSTGQRSARLITGTSAEKQEGRPQ